MNAVVDINVSNAKPLTGEGGKLAIAQEVREFLCFLDDGRLLVSKTHTFHPHVSAFKGRLERLQMPFDVTHVELNVIKKAYEGDSHHNLDKQALSDMQREATSLFSKAVKGRASDIHIRVSESDATQILFRLQGDLVGVEEHSYEYGDQLCNTIYSAMADVSDSQFEPMARQDARIGKKDKLPPKTDGIRIATAPMVDGYLMVLRMLYNDASDSTDLSELGFNEAQIRIMEEIKELPVGINITGGATGSGKSTSLQRVLRSVIKESLGKKHVITVEDPPEYPIPGAVQTPVTNAATEEERSAAYQKAIKAAMRLDPDVIMISEVRDSPTAKISIQAAMTGHQVWTTVHANSAFAILQRLIDLGVPSELMTDASIVTGLTCQQLVKVLCDHCKIPLTDVMNRYTPQQINRVSSLVDLGHVHVTGGGCEHCGQTGYKGRTVIAEIVKTDDILMRHLRKNDKSEALRYWKTTLNGITMADHAIEKIEAGLLDPFEASAKRAINTPHIDSEN